MERGKVDILYTMMDLLSCFVPSPFATTIIEINAPSARETFNINKIPYTSLYMNSISSP